MNRAIRLARGPSRSTDGKGFILDAIDGAIDTGYGNAQQRAAKVAGATVEERVEALSRAFARELGTIGAASGGVAAVPGVGTAAGLATSAADFAWFTGRAAELILTIAALHGHDSATVDERRAWILSVLLFGDGAAAGFGRLASEVGKGLGKKGTARVPMSLLRTVNGKMGRTIVTKYGTKRGVVALGRVLPFGIGMAIGGTANYVTVRVLARHADSFFRDLPFIVVDDGDEAVAVDVGDGGAPAE